MIRRSSPIGRALACAMLVVQIALATAVSWHDARAEGEGLRRAAHVETSGAEHPGRAHAPDCAVSQHLVAPYAPGAGAAPMAVLVARHASVARQAVAARAASLDEQPPSRAPPAAA